MQFTGPNVALEKAIDADDPRAVDAALAAGADANARGAHGVTPLEYAIGTFHKAAATALLRAHADPNGRDDEGDGPVSMAVMAWDREPALLDLVLAAGGDPNTKRSDGDPVIARFADGAHLAMLTYMHAHGASLDLEVGEQPMVVSYAISEDWDVVWRLIQLGARTDTPRVREGLIFAFKGPQITPPDSPLYSAKVAVYRHLKAQGLTPTPPAGLTE